MNMKNITEAFKQSVRTSAAKGGHIRWGENESTAAIVAAIVAGAMESGLDEIEANALATNLTPYVREVVNPSAYAQKLEQLPDGSGKDAEGEAATVSFDEASGGLMPFVTVGAHVAHPAYIRRPARGSRKGGSIAV